MKFIKLKWLWIGIVLLVVGVLWYQRSGGVQEYTSYTAVRGDVASTITVSGSLAPQRYADLSFESAQLAMGRIQEVMVGVGDIVFAGDELVRLDNSIARAQTYSAYKTAEAQEELEKLARRKWDDLKPEEKARWKTLSVAARANARTSALNAQKSTLTAPFDGVVTVQNAIVGMAPTAGTIMRIIDPASLEIEALVSESDITKISVGDMGIATFDALPADEKYPVKVIRLDPEATVIADVVYYKVYFNYPNVSGLRAGMSVDIDLIIAQVQDAITIPRRLVSTDADGKFVTILTDATTATTERRSVTIGLTGDDGTVEVTSGLKAGEQVVAAQKK